MSWLVENLLFQREEIRVKPDFNSDEYNNLLIVESKIKELTNLGVIDSFELAILHFVTSKGSYTQLEELLKINRNTLANHFKRICNRISYSLGYEFTDEGYLQYMQEKYNLLDSQIDILREHINGIYRHRIRRTV